MMEVMRIMQNQVRKKETEVQLLKDKQKELEFMYANAFRPSCACTEKTFRFFQ